MPRAIKILLIILAILLVFSLGKWLVIDSLLAGTEDNGRYRMEEKSALDS